jgi:hypothetical protein
MPVGPAHQLGSPAIQATLQAAEHPGTVIGSVGILSSVAPALNELGYAFGVGVIVWWIWLGVILLQNSQAASTQRLNLAIEG